MTPLSEALSLFKDNVVGGTIRAPDKYPDWNEQCCCLATRHDKTGRNFRRVCSCRRCRGWAQWMTPPGA
jgi:hypothetical protein